MQLARGIRIDLSRFDFLDGETKLRTEIYRNMAATLIIIKDGLINLQPCDGEIFVFITTVNLHLHPGVLIQDYFSNYSGLLFVATPYICN